MPMRPIVNALMFMVMGMIIATCLCVIAHGQEVPDTPVPQPRVADRAFYEAVVPLWMASTADAVSTNRALATGLCYESNPLLGSNPKPGTVWTFAAVTAGVYTAFTYALKGHVQRHGYKGRAWAIPAYAMTVVHAAATANNLARCR
jgi:hypothetical protein